MIVDDSEIFRAVARKLLEHRGNVAVGEADCAGGSLDAVELLTPNATLIDLGPGRRRRRPGAQGRTRGGR